MLRLSFLVSLLAAVLAAASPALAQDGLGKPETYRVWPGEAPGFGKPSGPEKIGNEGGQTGSWSNISEPRYEVYRPKRPNGAAALLLGGGGYFRIQIGSAKDVAAKLAAAGITPVILYYRLPGDGWNADAPFQDAQRTLRLLKAGAARWGLDPARIGVVGMSAGGHLAGMMATRGSHDFYPPADEADRLNAVPAFAGMIYPVVSMRPPIDTTQTRKKLSVLPDYRDAFSVEAQVGPDTPPVFLAHATDDPIANVEHSLRMFAAMRAAGRPVELHVFEKGGHSWGAGKPGTPVAQWPNLFLTWLRLHKVLP
ncbi:alpha/beta hydrolase [Sphingomonas sp. CBMAI 2297]|uniref:alpha/beta hydrolase n=1 Tax=Sphingomonas sp. CBMAI 2297 TaxID=2991720 RepID=UPI002458E1E0|nr:alpha/beta hydrolase [Sphingomonas sp. CBMAI 2297]MDH4743665.1 alpha/beta hydrolase [Sphingomonas sp. CBMAI 2297]